MVFFVFLLDFRIVPTVWYSLFFYLILELFRQCGILCLSILFWNCSDSVVFFVFLFDFRIVPTVWYSLFIYFILELFRQCGILCFSFCCMGFVKICNYEIDCLNVNAFVLYVLHGLLYTINHKCTYMNNTVW